MSLACRHTFHIPLSKLSMMLSVQPRRAQPLFMFTHATRKMDVQPVIFDYSKRLLEVSVIAVMQ